MFKHLLKLIWNRKASHGLIIAEITIAFLVVFGVATLAWSSWDLYNEPLGFEWENGLQVQIRNGGDWEEQDGRDLEQTLSILRDNPEIKSVSAMLFGPFKGWRSRTGYGYGDINTQSIKNNFSDGTHENIGLQLIDGRWTGPEDMGLAWESAVINRRLAETLFQGESPLGKNINQFNEKYDDPDEYRELHVVGVFEDFRQMGELSELTNYTIVRFAVEDYDKRAYSLIIYPQAGAPVSLQEDIVDTIQRIAPGWTVSITELSSMRKAMIDEVIMPLSVVILIATFLILMVGFGLFGVLWQSVTRRTSELGLRRAMGANRQRIYRQIVAEMCIGAGISVLIGSLIAIQIPILGTFDWLTMPVAISGMLISGTLILSLCFLCALYPGWLASRRSPATALHYE